MIFSSNIKLSTKGNTDIIDITSHVNSKISESNFQDGIVTVFVSGSTGALTTIEYEPGLVKDTKDIFDKLIPKNQSYDHNNTWGDGNGHSHLRASLTGPSLTVPFIKGKLALGTWQQIIFIDFDNRSRQRNIIIQIMGE